MIDKHSPSIIKVETGRPLIFPSSLNHGKVKVVESVSLLSDVKIRGPSQIRRRCAKPQKKMTKMVGDQGQNESQLFLRQT